MSEYTGNSVGQRAAGHADQPGRPDHVDEAGRTLPWAAVAVVCVAQFVVVLDATIVVTALPSIRPALGFSQAGLPWVITAYTLAFGGLLIPGGRVADLLGPGRVFGLGLAVFATGSAVCGLARAPEVMIAGRAVQGLGSALLSPAALALLTAISAPGPARRRAVAWWTAAAASGGASGWVLGGLFTEYLGWRAVFWVNVPIVAVMLVAGLRALPEGRRDRAARPDLGGGLTITATLVLLVLGLKNTGEQGPLPLLSWGPLLLAVVFAVVLVRHLGRAADPLIPLRLLRSRTVAGANLTAMALTATTTPAMYLATLYVQQVLRFAPARAALLFPVFNAGVIAGSLTGPVLLRRAGPRLSLIAGFIAMGCGAVLFVTLPDHGKPVAQLLVAFAVLGTGLGTASVASTQSGTTAAEELDPAYQGASSGVLNSSAQIGTALGLAVVTPLAMSASASITGYRPGFVGTALIAALGLAASFLVLPGGRPGRQDVS